MRDNTGSFQADNIGLDGYLDLNALQSTGPSGTTGSILKGGELFIHNIGGGTGTTNNTAVGLGAINPGVGGASNTAVGAYALNSVTSATNNVAIGNQALQNTTTGGSNTAVGQGAMTNNTTGTDNCAFGNVALASNTTGSSNIGLGQAALISNTTGGSNVAVGGEALYSNGSGSSNTAIGSGAVQNLSSGSNNTAVGASTALNLVTGSNNTMLGEGSGSNTVGGSNNIYINNVGMTESNTTRIGTQGTQTACYVAGITNVTTALPPNIYINPSTGQLQLSTFNPAMFSVQSTANPTIFSVSVPAAPYSTPGTPYGTFSTLPTSGSTGSFNPTTGIFTAGYTGAYQFNCAGQLLVNSSGTTPNIALYLNSNIFDQVFINVTGSFPEASNISVSTIMAMNMGDTAQVQFSNPGTGNYNVNVAYFSCSYIGSATP